MKRTCKFICLLLLLSQHHCWASSEGVRPVVDGGKSGFFSLSKYLHLQSLYKPYLNEVNGKSPGLDKAEIQGRLDFIKRIAGTNPLWEEAVKDLFLLEIHFSLDIQRRVPDWKVQDAYDEERFSDLGLENRQIEWVKKMIKGQIYFSEPGNIQEAENHMEKRVLKNQEEKMGGANTIPISRLRLTLDKNLCLAFFRNSDCLVTVEEFNGFLPFAQEQNGMSVAEAREYLLRHYAFQKVKAQKGRKNSSLVDTAAVLENVTSAIQFQNILKATRKMGTPVFDPEVLKTTYQKNYARYFSRRDSVLIQIIASSDSVYMDSLFELLGKRQEKNRPTKIHSVKDSRKPVPWLTFKEEELPLELVVPTDTFEEGQFTKPFRTESGFFIAKLFRVFQVPELPFSKAQAKCVYLATREKYLGFDSVVNARALKYYHDNSREFSTPDTSHYQFWLVPHARYRSVRNFIADTGVVRSMVKWGSDIPRFITKPLNSGAIPDSLKMHLIDNKYGQMLVKLMKVKKGGSRIPFSNVKQEIVEKLLKDSIFNVPLAENPADVDSAVSEKILINLGTSDLVYQDIIGETNNLSLNEVEAAIKAGRIDVSDINPNLSRSQYLELAKKRFEIKRLGDVHQEIQRVFEEVEFEIGYLSAN